MINTALLTSMAMVEPCPGYSDENANLRCGKHHFTELGNMFGGYDCCCGKNWTVDGCSSALNDQEPQDSARNPPVKPHTG